MAKPKRPRLADKAFCQKIRKVCAYLEIDLRKPDKPAKPNLPDILGLSTRQVTSLLNGVCDWELHHLDTFAKHIGVTTNQLRHLDTDDLLQLLMENKKCGGGQ